MKRKQDFDIQQDDVTILKQQLSHVKTFIEPKKIISRCKWGYPRVTFLMDSKKKSFVPGTLLWLTCPRVSHFISKIEEKKYTQELQEEIDENEESNLKDELLKSNDVFKQWVFDNDLLSKEDFSKWISSNKETDLEKAVQNRFHNTGVSVDTSIKCLHAHTAVYLSGIEDKVGKLAVQKVKETNNLVGDIEDLSILDCPEDCVQCGKFTKDPKELNTKGRKKVQGKKKETKEEKKEESKVEIHEKKEK